MTIGGLTVGVTPLDMAHSYETIAHQGRRVSGSMAAPGEPVGVQEVASSTGALPDGSHRDINSVRTKAVLPPEVAATETTMLESVLQYGTGKAAAIGQFAAGKTGTTSNYGDAWFVGWDSKYTVAVWVGFPNKLISMSTDFNGTPVLGGTFPALIWHDFMTSALSIDKARTENAAKPKDAKTGSEGTSSGESETGAPATPSSSPATPAPNTPSGSGKTGEKQATPSNEAGGGAATPEKSAAPATPAPSHEATPAPAPSAPAGGETPASPSPTGGVSPSG
jgi:penicillin-binding protein 1A